MLVTVAIVLLFLVESAFAQQPRLQGVDFTGVQHFWRIAELLQRDKDPTASAWDSLFATPGYAALQEREKRRPALTAGIRAALMPSRRAELDSLLATNSWTGRVARHTRGLPARKRELDALQAKLVRDDVLQAAIARAQTLLPERAAERYGVPGIAFVFFLPDGRGYPSVIVADLANTADKLDPVPFFAHEVTHFYYARIARERLANAQMQELPPERAALEQLLTKLFEESVGDQFDKAPFLELSDADFESAPIAPATRSYLREYRRHVADAARHIAGMSAALANAASDPMSLKLVSDSLGSALPLEGRPIGYVMTRAIRRIRGDAVVAAAIGDPVSWFAAYQSAARQPACRCRAFSDLVARMVAAASRGHVARIAQVGVIAVALSGADSVAILDAGTLDRIAVLPVGKNPHEIAASPDGRRAYVANAGATSISVIEVAPTPRVFANWQLRDSVSVHDLAVSADGKTLWAISGAQNVVLDIDAASGAQRRRFDLEKAGGWLLETGGPNGTLVIANLEGGAVTLLDPRTARQRVFATTEGEIDAVPTPDGSQLWAVNVRTGNLTVIDPTSGRVITQQRVGERASRIRFTSDGRLALIPSTGDSTVSVLETVSGRRIASLQVPGGPKVIALDNAGRFAYVSHPEHDAVTMIDVQSMRVIRTVPVGKAPDGVAVLQPR